MAKKTYRYKSDGEEKLVTWQPESLKKWLKGYAKRKGTTMKVVIRGCLEKLRKEDV